MKTLSIESDSLSPAWTGREVFVDRKAAPNSKEESIVVYSQNMELCVGMQLALENKYCVLTTTDRDVLILLVKSFEPDLIVMIAPFPRGCKQLLCRLKSSHPKTRILVCASRLTEIVVSGDDRRFVDGVVTEPIAIDRLTEIIQAILHE